MGYYAGGAFGCFVLFLLCDVDKKFYASNATYRYMAIAIFASLFPVTLPMFLYTEFVEK